MENEDGPFLPSGLSPEESRVYAMGFHLACRGANTQETYRDGHDAYWTCRREIGFFAFEMERVSVSEPAAIIRHTVMIWFNGKLVFNAWSAKTGPSGTLVGMVVTHVDGPWKYRLRRRFEADSAP